MKRVLAIFLCVLMLAALFPISALATDDEGISCLEGYEHNYSVISSTTPTCTAKGSITYQCSNCDHTYTTEVAALGHDYDDGVITNPTCSAGGYTTYTCSRCGATETGNPTSALGHAPSGEGVVTAPTCTAAGYTSFTCAHCSESYTVTGAAALGHSLGEGVVTAPTCTAAGYTTYSCTRDGCNYTCTEDGPAALGHDYECVVTREPTDEEDGLKTYTCTRCGDSYTETFSNQPAVILATALRGNPSETKDPTPEKISISTAVIAAIPDQVYTGSAITPTPTVTMDGGATSLVKDTDYTVTYANNVNIGEEAAVIVVGIGNYSGSAMRYFNITPIPLTIKVKDQTYIYNGQEQGEGDPAYDDPNVIAKKITITNGALLEGDSVTSIVLSGHAKEVDTYIGRIEASGAVIGENTGHYNIDYAPGNLTILPADAHTVSVKANPKAGGTPEASPDKAVKDTVITLTPNPADGYTFKEWKVKDNIVTITGNKFKIGVSDVEITAVYEEEKPTTTYTVTFNANGHGTAPASQTIEAGKTATNPGNLSETGWTFNGWYTTSAGTTKFDFSTPINSATTIYAKWTEKVVYNVKKGEFTRWWKGGIEGISITVERSPNDKECFSHFTGVKIDGSKLSSSAYTAKKGSTVVYLKPETLNKLHRGYHDVTILFDDGSAYAEVKIYSGAPKTGDGGNPGAWLALLLVSGFAFGGLATVALKRPRKSGKR